MSADSERYPPPNEPAAFESLCLDLWKEIWGDPGAQKNGRSGQPQAGVDVFGRHAGRWVGVQCKQKDGLLRSKVSVSELNAEVREALSFKPAVSIFILATTGPADAKVQERAREITIDHEARGLFEVQVWSWEKIWHEIYGRKALLDRLLPIYWPRTSGAPQRVAPSKLRHQAPHLFGRDDELSQLEAAWKNPTVNVVTIVAWGGIGKTSLVAAWLGGLASRNHDGTDFFDWSFYSQGTREQGGASSDPFIAAALEFFGGEEGKLLANSPASPWDKGARLAQWVGERRALLVLDGLEPLQHPPGPLAGQLKDPAIIALLKGLAAKNAGLCVVTTRVSVEDLARFRSGTAPEWKLERLSTVAGVELLTTLGVRGTEAEMKKLVKDVRGHALTLSLLGKFLRDAHGGDIRKRDLVKLDEADHEVQGDHAFKVMEAYEKWLGAGGEGGQRMLAILRLLGLFDRPAAPECLAALRKAPTIPGLTEPLVDLSDAQWNLAISRLAQASLISPPAESAALDAHPLVREHFARRLRGENEGAAWRAAHSRLFDHLKDSVEYQPDTLEGLQPLYQAVAHGCLAGRQQEAAVMYSERILRGREFYSTRRLGAFAADLGAVACFFEPGWSRVSPTLWEVDQAWFLAEAAFDLRALGRLTEALEPMRAGLGKLLKLEDWARASGTAGNLSELELTLGDVSGSVRDAEQSVTYADRSSNAFERLTKRATVADALHQKGRREEALERFREAEQLEIDRQTPYPLLYSLRGFQYCDVLLGQAERAAWNLTLLLGPTLLVGTPTRVLRAMAPAEKDAGGAKARALAERGHERESTRQVEVRAAQTLQWVTSQNWLLDIALDQLTLARAGLYRAILEGATHLLPDSEIRDIVEGLRRAGQHQFIPLGLLTRAWLRALQGNPEAARADLDEAQEIAERGPMPLHLADIHLHRARLFRDRAALAAARKLIEKHGYWRRKEELEDAEAAAREW